MKNSYLIICIVMGIIGLYFLIPDINFGATTSTVLFSNEGDLLGAKIAEDEQWRFPQSDSVPEKFREALITYEDKRFDFHRGIDVIRIFKAAYDNMIAGKIVSGASTLNMQLARIYKGNTKRNLWNKLWEIMIALKCDIKWSKNQVLVTYASNAPFGGNVIGLEAASWRYFAKNPHELTWAESATLAVLPNSPGIIHPGRNRAVLREKRDQLLERLWSRKKIDRDLMELSKLESIAEEPMQLPQLSPHLLAWADQSKWKGRSLHTSINRDLQLKVNDIAENHHYTLAQNGIHNLAVLIVENDSRKVITYTGNTEQTSKVNREHFVDMIRAKRSSGSIIKPLLYGIAFDEGLITNKQLLPDIPGRISGYRPRNFNRGFEGAVHADKALARSLNIPAVYLLQDYSVDKFILKLKEFGLSTITENAEHYGLPLILGGADVKLWELVSIYSGLAAVLNDFGKDDTTPDHLEYRMPLHISSHFTKTEALKEAGRDPLPISPGAIWLTFQAMSKVERPDQLGNWQKYMSSKKIAWKTGTSFGHKDAWSIGISKNYTVGVWVGNATGEGRPGLTGIKAAAPVLFQVFDMLDDSAWFTEPSDDLKEEKICKDSGYPLSPFCEDTLTTLVPYQSNSHKVCPYHQSIHVDKSGSFHIPSECSATLDRYPRNYFVLPPLMEHYYARSHPEYINIPECHALCLEQNNQDVVMEMIYPNDLTKIVIPVDFDLKKGRVIFKLAHRKPSTRVFWYIGQELYETTTDFHEIEFFKAPGSYQLLVVDEKGHELKQRFDIIE